MNTVSLRDLLGDTRSTEDPRQESLGFGAATTGPLLWYEGDVNLVQPCVVAVVGTREVSPHGASCARDLGRQLAQHGIVVMSGLARGVDTEVLSSAIHAEGRVVGVIGTPIDRAYPPENTALQQEIASRHLLISQFRPGDPVLKGNFVARNRLMAALSDATVIVEAGEASGAWHQALECVRLGRRLFIARGIMDNAASHWASRVRPYPNVLTMTSVEDVLADLCARPETHRHGGS
jgi:DNA processing protein